VLKQHLFYDPETGIFTRLISESNRSVCGSDAGGYGCQGYYRVSLLGRRYYAHRLAWFYMTGRWPARQIDHINGIKDDNRFCNLREATATLNAANVGRKATNKSGFKNVNFDARSGRWLARARINGKRVNLGLYDTPEAAYAAFCGSARRGHGAFFHP